MTVVTVTLTPSIDKTLAVKHVVANRKLTADSIREDPGGGGINVARVVARFGGRALALWNCGGEMGHRLARKLSAEGVPHKAIEISDEVGENIVVTDSSTADQYRFNSPGPQLTEGECLQWTDTLRQLPSTTPFVVFSGSLQASVSTRWYGELLRAVPSGSRVVVDTKQAALHEALECGVFLIKPNVHELEESTGRSLCGDGEIEGAARDIIERGGAEIVVVSLGRGGALLVTAHGSERYSAPSVPLRSKVGAGDSMVGGLVSALARGRTLADAVRFGVAAGAAAVMTEGTQLCRAEDTQRLYRSFWPQSGLKESS